MCAFFSFLSSSSLQPLLLLLQFHLVHLVSLFFFACFFWVAVRQLKCTHSHRCGYAGAISTCNLVESFWKWRENFKGKLFQLVSFVFDMDFGCFSNIMYYTDGYTNVYMLYDYILIQIV